MMLRFAIPFLLGLAFFAGLEAWAGPKRDFSMPMWLALLTIPAALSVYIGGGMTFAPFFMLAANLVFRDMSDAAGMISAGISYVAGIWLAAMTLQVVQNLVRAMQGRKREPMRWLTNPFNRRN